MKGKCRAIVPVLGGLWFAVLAGGAQGGGTPAEAGGRERVDALRAEIAHHDELYFRQATPEISDADYDRLKRELAVLERAQPERTQPAPVGDDRSGRFPTQAHRERMLSLDKAYSEREWRDFHARVVQRLGRPDAAFVLEPKYDGVAISLVYEHGRLVRAITRGNGSEGDDVTANVRMIRSLPATFRSMDNGSAPNPMPDLVELRGEVYVGDGEFARINAAREAAGEEPFAHPRNLAAGTLKSLDPVEVAARQLSVVVYTWGAWVGAGMPASQQAFHAVVHAWGLPGVARFRVINSADEGWAAIRDFQRTRQTLGFPVDGVVLKLDDAGLREKLGASEQAPRWAVAYKYEPERAVAQIRAITIQVGRTGLLTPVAEFEPVVLAGTRVTRATLHNRAAIARRDVRVGDFVEIEKAGEIIPAVVAVQLERRPPDTKPFEFPGRCPSCGDPVTSKPGEIALRCLNAVCPGQRQRRLEHFASAAAVDIAGLGPGTIAALIREGLVATPSDLYRLKPEDLEAVKGLGDVRARQLLAEIDRSRRSELWRFIYGLGIPQIGPVNARRLAETCGSLANLARWDEAQLAGAVGAAAGRSAADFLARPQIRTELQALTTGGVQPALPQLPAGKSGLPGTGVSPSRAPD